MFLQLLASNEPISNGLADSFNVLWWPGVTFLLSSIVAILAYLKFLADFDEWLSAKRQRKTAYFAFMSVTLLFVGAWADIVDISEVLSGNSVEVSTPLLCLVAFLLAFLLFLQMVWWAHGDRSEQRIEQAQLTARREEGKAARLKDQRDYVRLFAASLAGVVGLQTNRARSAVVHEKSEAKLTDVLSPSEQVFLLIQAIFQIYRGLLDREDTAAKLRIAYFKESRAELAPVYSWDGATRDCLRTWLDGSREWFKLKTKRSPSAAVSAVKAGCIEIVDCSQKHDIDGKSSFQYFHDAQRNEIKSLVAIPIIDNSVKDAPKRVITIDTDRSGFFSESDRQQLEFVKSQIQGRILLQEAIAELIDIEVGQSQTEITDSIEPPTENNDE